MLTAELVQQTIHEFYRKQSLERFSVLSMTDKEAYCFIQTSSDYEIIQVEDHREDTIGGAIDLILVLRISRSEDTFNDIVELLSEFQRIVQLASEKVRDDLKMLESDLTILINKQLRSFPLI